MPDVVPGGRRRIDRVLDPEFVLGLGRLPMDELAERTGDAQTELAELTGLAAQLDSRSTMILAEQRRRAPTEPGSAGTASADEPAAPDAPSRLARVFRLRTTPEAPPTRRRRRRVERLINDVDLSDVGSRTDDELARVLRTFRHEQRLLDDAHARVRAVVARCADELSRRGTSRTAGARSASADTRSSGAKKATEPHRLPNRPGTASR
jgi:hypothetical protein